MRLFVAVEVLEKVKESLKKFIEEAQRIPGIPAKVKWVKPENFHFTLKFLGEVSEDRLELLENHLSKSVAGSESFDMEVRGVGVFPGFQRARVLWMGVQEGADALKNLAERVESSLTSVGFPPADKPFSAHATVARFSVPPSPAFLEKMKSYELSFFGNMRVDKINLMQSHLSPAGPRYTFLKQFCLE